MLSDYLIARAKRTPYYHLDGYMNRWWLVPYKRVIERRSATVRHIVINGEIVGEAATIETTVDGTGPVSWRRPIAKLIQKLGFAVRVHEILSSDQGRDPHDHPWPYVAIILRGGYWETRYNAAGEKLSEEWHGPGSVLYRPAGSWHRLDLGRSRPVFTLFITGNYVGTWGFNVNGTKVPHYEYDLHQRTQTNEGKHT